MSTETKTKYTAEPWVKLYGASIISEAGPEVAKGVGANDAANAARIVACVNACAGVEDPAAFVAAALAESKRHRDSADTGHCPCGLCAMFRQAGALGG